MKRSTNIYRILLQWYVLGVFQFRDFLYDKVRWNEFLKKQRGLVFKLSFITISTFLVLFLVFIIISNQYIYFVSKKDQQAFTNVLSEESALLIQKEFSETISSLNADRDLIVSLYNKGLLTSETIIEYKKEVLSSNEDILGYSLILNASDFTEVQSTDEKYIDKGFFTPYFNRVDGTVQVGSLTDAASEDWYSKPKESGSTYITEPYEYTLNGKELSLVSVAVPIYNGNQFLGVSIADFSLDFLDEVVQANAPDTGILRVITEQGTILSDSFNKDYLMTNVSNLDTDWTEIKNTLDQGSIFSEYSQSVSLEEEAYNVFMPIHFGTDAAWAVQIVIPKSTMSATFFTIFKLSIGAAIIISLLLAGITAFFINRQIKPLKNVQEALNKASDGDLTAVLETDKLKHDEIGAVGTAYNTMRISTHNVVTEVSIAANQVDNQAELMNRLIDEMAQSSAEISTAIDEIAKGSYSQSEEIEQSNVQLSMLGDAIDELALTSHQVMLEVLATEEQANLGMVEVRKLRTQSDETNAVNHQLERQMQNLSQKIKTIDVVMQSIQGISAQTNLLALNASIEAARAGEHGKGFAVVADEVRKLAEQSQKETESVQQTVLSILHEASQTEDIVQKSSILITSQSDSVTSTESAFQLQLQKAELIERQIKDLISKLTSMLEQKEQAMTGMQTIAAISEQSAASAEEVTASADEQVKEMHKIAEMMHELNEVASGLKASTEQFKL